MEEDLNGRDKSDINTTEDSKCTMCEESFYHEDELALHMEYFHGCTSKKSSQQ